MNQAIKKLETIAKKYFTTELVLALLAISVFVSIIYLQHVKYEDILPSLDELFQHLDGKEVDYFEPTNTGLGLLIYYTAKAIPIGYVVVLKAYQIIFLIIFLILFYKITNSLKLTLLTMAYPPMLINTVLIESSIVLVLYFLPLYLYLKNKKTISYLLGIPLVLFRHEGLLLYAGFLIYEVYLERKGLFFNKVFSVVKRNWLNIILVFAAWGGYMYFQYFFFGHPLANFMLNVKLHVQVNFPLYIYVLRWAMIAIAIATSFVLYYYNKLLFVINSLLIGTYLYFVLFGSFEYSLFAIQIYFIWLFAYTSIAAGYLSGEIKMACAEKNQSKNRKKLK